ncbi:MAG TPA: transposase [Verrucomicrobiota bacterium]|nr:transposase [Verrucomicrobiota bacterium]
MLADGFMQVYRARNPKKSPLWQCAHRHYDEFEDVYPEAYAPRYGRLRPIIPEVVHKFLDCGNLERGFARVRCDHCEHEYLLAFSCKSRWFCPSCHQKNVQITARFILERVVAPVPHRHYVLAIPRMLRPYFQRHRHLLKRLCALAHQSLTDYLRTALACPKGVPGIIMTLHTFGEYLDFHPHVHALVADGLFLRNPPDPPPQAPTPASRLQPPACPTFHALPESPLKPLEELFRAKVISLLVAEKLLPPERVQVLYSWKHSGFNLHAGELVPPEAKADLEDLAQYILRNPFSVEKMTLESPTDMVIYRSRLNAKINRNFEVFTPTDFLAAITQHIPDKGAQMVRYYGWYSNKMRGVRQRGLPPELVFHRPGVSPPPPLKLPSKRWRDLILRVWHVDPLRCPVCQNPMRVIAVIDDPRVVEKILRHLGAWHDPPVSSLQPAGSSGPYTYEPCDDVEPTPDYENVLTD